jgi:hypothetical protein
MSATATLQAFKSAVVDQGLEDQFLKVTGLSSLDELSPDNFRAMYGRADSLTKQIGVPLSAAVTPPPATKEDADASARKAPEEASDFLSSFKDMTIRFPPRPKNSTFYACPTVMYVIVHIMNQLLVDHFYFLRAAPNFHPALLRIYFGVTFVIQTLRAQHAAQLLQSHTQNDFLTRFLDAFPTDTLPIPAPLLHIFKSISSSKPEIPQLALVSPIIPGELIASTKTLKDHNDLFASPCIMYLPDINGILSLLALQSTSKGYKKGFHPKFSTTADTTFRGATFDKDSSTWGSWLAWSLRAPGIEHPFESGKKLNESFFDDRYEDLDLPAVGGTDKVSTIDQWLKMDKSLSWFVEIRDIVSQVCKFFPGSGSLSDCSPVGLRVPQIVMQQSNYATAPTAPTGFTADSRFNLDLKFQLITSCRSISQMEVIMAAASGINFRAAANDPARNARKSVVAGPFWDIRPLEKSTTEEDRFFGMIDSIKRGIKDKA